MEGAASLASILRGSRGRGPIPITPDILHLFDRLEPDKEKHARLLTEHITRQRTLHVTEEELQQHLERKATGEIKRQHAAAETITNKAMEEQMEAARTTHEAAMAVHLARHAMMAASLATLATTEEAIST